MPRVHQLRTQQPRCCRWSHLPSSHTSERSGNKGPEQSISPSTKRSPEYSGSSLPGSLSHLWTCDRCVFGKEFCKTVGKHFGKGIALTVVATPQMLPPSSTRTYIRFLATLTMMMVMTPSLTAEAMDSPHRGHEEEQNDVTGQSISGIRQQQAWKQQTTFTAPCIIFKSRDWVSSTYSFWRSSPRWRASRRQSRRTSKSTGTGSTKTIAGWGVKGCLHTSSVYS